MYKILKLLSYLARHFLLPNPFANLFIDKNIAEIVNWIFGGILIPLSYILTGTWYDGEFKSLGMMSTKQGSHQNHWIFFLKIV